MNVALATIRKELISYLFSPVAYVIAVLLYLFQGIHVYNTVIFASDAHWDTATFASVYVTNGPVANLFFVLVPPILTMRCFAEEKRSGSLEVLMTAPVRDLEIVLGKWFAALVFFVLLWLPTLPLLGILSSGLFLDQPVAYGPVLASYLGLFLLGAMLLAVGVFTSSVTDNTLLASIVAMLFNYVLLSAPQLIFPRLMQWREDSYVVQTFMEQSNVFDHLINWFGRGQIDSSKIAFYLGGVAFFLFLTVRSLESRKWR